MTFEDRPGGSKALLNPPVAGVLLSAKCHKLFRPIHDRTCGVDGWVSLEVSPLLAHDTKTTLAEAKDLHARAARPNLFIKIPGTKEGLPAIERRSLLVFRST